jgi:DNA polymerase III delta prime subunit
MPPSKSRLTLARAAIRPSMHGKMMLSGPSGAGKTFTALAIAEVLAGADGKILHIDTEKESALTYADLFAFEHIRWAAPFDPRELQETLLDAGRIYDAIIVDSFTHFWRGSGGTLDIAGGKFTGWKDARPAQVDVVEAVLEADCHVIVCCRSKMQHVQQQAANGKFEVVKLGMAVQQDDDFEYEVNVSVEMDMQHLMQIGKSRTNAIPVGRQFTAGHAPEFAAIYRDWLKGGEPVATNDAVQALIEVLNRIPDQGDKVQAKQAFLAVFGRPEFLLQSRLEEAREWVADRVLGLTADQQGAPGVGPAPSQADAAPTPPEATTNGATGDSEPDDTATETLRLEGLRRQRLRAAAQEIAENTDDELRAALEAADLDTDGKSTVLRKRLAEHMVEVAEAAT